MHKINPTQQLTFNAIKGILDGKKKLQLSDLAKEKIIDCRNFLDKVIGASDAPIYGINTGFGSLCDTSIAKKDLEQLQKNLVMSHACGVGNTVPLEIVKLMLLLKIQGLSYGYSGVQLATVERLIYFFNNDILPVVYEQGSLGASGDLVPLAHLSLPLIGLGEVHYKGNKKPAAEVLKQLDIEPIVLKSKEGLALLNGTQFMSAYGVWCLLQSYKISRWADIIGAMSLDAFDGKIEPFNNKLHTIRPHAGQINTAKYITSLLGGSEILKQPKVHVQDPYSFRCIPQVHGASKDVINYVANTFLTEINSVTDNPTVFAEDEEVLSGGNFHGQPLAIALDMLCIGLHELGNISERRTYQLVSGQRGLPPFLTKDAGINSGFMIPQYTAASLVSQSKQLCTPASADSIVSSNGQEDHVSMGANAALKCFTIVENTITILAIELMNAAQALEFRKPLKTSSILEKIIADYRKVVGFNQVDSVLQIDIQASQQFLKMYGVEKLAL